MAMPILPKLGKGKPSPPVPPSKPKPPKPPPSFGAKDEKKPEDEHDEEDETLQDEADESPEEQADEAAKGTELHDPEQLATAAEGAANEAGTYASRVEDLIEKAGEDHPMAQALQSLLKSVQDTAAEADAGAEEARKGASDEDIAAAAGGAAKAAEACERIRRQMSIFEGGPDVAAEKEQKPPARDVPGPGDTDKAADKAPPASPMGAWMNRYAK